MTRSTLVMLLKYAFGLALLAFVVARNWNVTQDGESVGLSVILERPIDVRFLVLGLALNTIGVLLTFSRWYYLVVAQGLPITGRDVLRLGVVGFFFNTFLPGAVGGDLVKAGFLIREQSRRTLAVATVILDRVIGLAGLFWLVVFLGGTLYLTGSFDALLVDTTARLTIETILGFACCVVVGTLLVWGAIGLISPSWLDRVQDRLEAIPKVGHPLAELIRAVRVYRQKGRYVALALGISMVSHGCFVLTFYAAARVFNGPEQLPPLLAHLLIVPIGMTFRAAIPLPGGIGGAELGYGKLYQWLGAPFASGVLGSLGQLVFLLILGGGGMIAYRIIESRRRPPIVAQRNESVSPGGE